MTVKKVIQTLIILISFARPSNAQVIQAIKETVSDPTTYAPFAFSFTGKTLDWNSSQVLFRNGYVEDNPDFTINGLTHDLPVSYGQGLKKITVISLRLTGWQMMNNFTASIAKQVLEKKYPRKKKLFKTMYWMEKIIVSGYYSYHFSEQNFKAWRNNVNTANKLGFK